MRDFLLGAGCLLRGLAWLRDRRVRRQALAPLLLSAAAWGVVLLLGLWLGLPALWEHLAGWLPDWLDWLGWLLMPLAALSLLAAAAFLWVPLANLLGGPFHEALAATVARALGHPPRHEPGWKGQLAALGPSLARGLRFLLAWLGGALLLGLLSLLPGLALAAPAGWALLGAWLMAWEHLAYPLAVASPDPRADREALARRRALRLGFGLAALALAAVPLLQLVAVPAAVAGAVELWHRARPPRRP